MPPFGDDESFRSFQPDTSHSVNISIGAGDDTEKQNSRAQPQQARKAGDPAQPHGEKRDKGTSSRTDDILNTISEDLGGGRIAKFDGFLQSLLEDESKYLLQKKNLDDSERFAIETFLSPQEFWSLGSQERRETYLKYQRAVNNAQIDHNNVESFFERVRSWTVWRTETAKLAGLDKIGLLDVLGLLPKRPLAIFYKNSTKSQSPWKMRRKNIGGDDIPSVKKRKRELIQRGSQNTVKDRGGVKTARSDDILIQPSESPLSPHLALLYEVECDDPECHPFPVFWDLPKPKEWLYEEENAPYRRPHLSGDKPVFDLQAYMDNGDENVAFVLVRKLKCSSASVMMANSGTALTWTEAIYIKSKMAKSALQQIATCYFSRAGLSGPSGKMQEFEKDEIYPADLFFFHHHHLLRTWSTQDHESKEQIKAFVKYMDTKYSTDFAKSNSLFERGVVTQAHILKLFKPNDHIISETSGRTVAYVLRDWPYSDPGGFTILNCWSFQPDGSGFDRKATTLDIPQLDGDTNIQSLTVYPLQFASSDIRKLLLNRGQKQWQYRTMAQITYKGWNVGEDLFFPDARFIIDHAVYRKMHPYGQAFRFDKSSKPHRFDQMPTYLKTDDSPSDLCFLVMPPDIAGFYLTEKKWINLYVDCIEPVTWNSKAFERLVLPEETKDLVRALVTVRTSQRGIKQGLGAAGKRIDITNGKGNGLIMLLHGGPGTGKTLTAESVAEIAEMPLYRVTCGDIGTNAMAVEDYLNTVLHLGNIWNCVLLLDEADVFLEERSMQDLKRNSLVSVFLRILEYYDGILILTSNRIGTFDEAFKSRIQVALHYENLTRPSRKMIWQNFLDMLEEDEEDVDFDELKLHLDDLAGKELNGRQIRNVLTTARQLAIYRKERLKWKHLKQALTVSSNFSDYLKDIQGHTDDQRARDIGLR